MIMAALSTAECAEHGVPEGPSGKKKKKREIPSSENDAFIPHGVKDYVRINSFIFSLSSDTVSAVTALA